VRAASPDIDTIFAAMNRGDFYASTGVALKDIRFDKATGTLEVEVEPKTGEVYEITFTVTRKDFDRTVTPFDDPGPGEDRKSARDGRKSSDTIGIAAKKVSGVSASYTLQPDDLYVRATVTSTVKREKPALCGPFVETAWTQPYRK